jgi:putative transposase
LSHVASIASLLSLGLIIPAEGKKPARKDHKQITQQVATLRAQMKNAGDDAEAFVAMTNLMEQACNGYLRTGDFPTTYEELQPIPVLSVGLLPLAGDDGMSAGQTYRARIKVSHFCDLQTRQEHLGASLWVKLRCPDAQGTWVWGKWSDEIPLPPVVGSRRSEASH